MDRKTINAAAFKARCLALIDEVAETGQPITVTKRGKAKVQIVAVREKPKTLIGATKGTFKTQIVRSWAPRGADRFYDLVKNKYYDGVRFFRVVPGFELESYCRTIQEEKINAVFLKNLPFALSVAESAPRPEDPVSSVGMTAAPLTPRAFPVSYADGGAQTVAVSCPFCLTMLGDGVTGKKSTGTADDAVEVIDVATVLLRSVMPD